MQTLNTKTAAKARPYIQKSKLIPGLGMLSLALMLAACGDINNSWEVKGGGYFKYSVNGEGPFTIELDKNDVEPPFYVNNQHRYFYAHTRLEASSRDEQFSLLVAAPTTGKDLPIVARANIGGRMKTVSWMKAQNSIEGSVITDSSFMHFDEMDHDSIWTADVDAYFKDCRPGTCKDSLPPLHVTGRLRYWVPADER